MTKTFLCLLFAFSATAQAEVSPELLENFKAYAIRDLVNFGAPKGTELSYSRSLQGYFVLANNVILGNAVVYERCLASLDKVELKLSCYVGLSTSLDLCRIQPSICQKDGIKQKFRELYLDPNPSNGFVMKGIGQHKIIPHMQSLTELAKRHASARNAIAEAMALNGCKSIELGDIAGQVTYLEQRALGDEDSKEIFEGAQNRWRATMACKTANTSVYLDVVTRVENGKINLSLVPVKAVEGRAVLIETVDPISGN